MWNVTFPEVCVGVGVCVCVCVLRATWCSCCYADRSNANYEIRGDGERDTAGPVETSGFRLWVTVSSQTHKHRLIRALDPVSGRDRAGFPEVLGRHLYGYFLAALQDRRTVLPSYTFLPAPSNVECISCIIELGVSKCRWRYVKGVLFSKWNILKYILR